MKSNTSNGDFVAMYFPEIFHQGVKEKNNVFLARLPMLKLTAYIKIGFRFNSSDHY